MAKQGQHKNDDSDQTKSRSRNNPANSVDMTPGSYKKQETYHKQAGQHKDPGKTGVSPLKQPNKDTHSGLTHEADSRARMADRQERSGSDSNAGSRSEGE